jgi:hypothetical protein
MIYEKETQTAAIFSLDVQSRFDVRFIFCPCPMKGFIPYLNGEVSYQTYEALRSAPGTGCSLESAHRNG